MFLFIISYPAPPPPNTTTPLAAHAELRAARCLRDFLGPDRRILATRRPPGSPHQCHPVSYEARVGPMVRAADQDAAAVNNERFQQQDSHPVPAPTLQQPPLQQQVPAGVSQGQYRDQNPQRATSTSHRLSAHLLGQSSQDYQQQPGPPQASPVLEPNRRSYQPQASPVPYAQEPKKPSLRSRIAAGVKGHKDAEAAKQAQKNGVGRAQSVRKTESRPQEFPSPEHSRLQASQQWHQRQGSSPHLPTSNEQDEDHLDPFLQQDDRNTPQVPPKDLQYQQNPQQHQHFVPNPHQEQYGRPALGRVSTEGSYQTRGGVDYSPDQGQGPPQQQTSQQQQQYPGYSSAGQHPQSSNEYQAFNPQNTPSPLLGTAQLHGQGQDTTQQQNYYQYQQQQAPQQVQGQSSLDNSPQSVHYPQQQQIPFHSQPQPQPRQAQDLQQQQPQSVRAPLQQHTELQHPQVTRHPLQTAQQGQHIDTQQSSQLRPPSSQQLSPPSPLQPQAFQTYDAQQGKQLQPSEPVAQNITPPQQGQNIMAPSGQGNGRNTLRKVNDGGQQPGAPSRESSLLQQPPAQGQPHGQPPVSPGITTFDANVVPTASQGQPYRGEKGQPAQQSGEVGRATPPPRSTSELTDEEIEKMMKEHEVLRECAMDKTKGTATNTAQAKSTRRSRDTSSSSRHKYISCKTPSPTSVCPCLGHPGTTANMPRASTD